MGGYGLAFKCLAFSVCTFNEKLGRRVRWTDDEIQNELDFISAGRSKKEAINKHQYNKIVKDNDPALVNSFTFISLSTNKRVFLYCFNDN